MRHNRRQFLRHSLRDFVRGPMRDERRPVCQLELDALLSFVDGKHELILNDTV